MSVRRTMVTTAVAVAALATACAPQAASEEGRAVSGLYDVFLYVAAGVFAVTAGLIAWSLIRFRDRGGDELPPQFHSNVKLELLWFAIPQIIVIVLFVLSAVTLGRTTVGDGQHAAVRLRVTGYQWGWRFEYPEHDVSVAGTPEDPAPIYVPTGRIALELTSADVVHAFYVPRFLNKRDTIPGRTIRMHVTADTEGSYGGACAEFCGLLHDRMTFTIDVVSPDEFEQWLDGQKVER